MRNMRAAFEAVNKAQEEKTMKNANTATTTTTTTTTNNNNKAMKGEKIMANYTNMKKVDLVNLLNAKDQEILLLNMKIEGLETAIRAIRSYTKDFVVGMNNVYSAEVVKAAYKAVETPKNTEKQADEAEKPAEKPAETPKAAPVKPEAVKLGKGKTQKQAEAEILAREEAKKAENQQKMPEKQYEHRYIAPWRLKKYGSVEKCIAVDEAAKIVAQEWADQKRKTGKNVVPYKDYKTRLYEEAERRVNEAEAAAAKATKATKKGGKR